MNDADDRYGAARPPRDDARALLARLDRAALVLAAAAPVLGLLQAAQRLLAVAGQPAPGLLDWLGGSVEAAYTAGLHTLAGLVGAILLRLLGRGFALSPRPWLNAPDPAAVQPGQGAATAPGPDNQAHEKGGTPVAPPPQQEPVAQSLLEIRRLIHDAQWVEALVRFEAISRVHSDDPRIPPMREELEAARGVAARTHRSQLDAARKVNDPERVLELHQQLVPLMEAEARAELESDLAGWLLRLVHHRLRSGRLQADLVVLSGRIAEEFSHTAEGASLRASLPTLRRSVGLCPRCGGPYSGIAQACPACLGASRPAGPAAPAPPPD